MQSWLIHYADGSTFSGEDGSPDQSPVRDVKAVTDWPDSVQHSAEYYIYRSDLQKWWATTLDGVLYQLMRDPSVVGVVRKGTVRKRANPYELRTAYLHV